MINSHALYQCVVRDVRGFISREQYVVLEKGGIAASYPDDSVKARLSLSLCHSLLKKFQDEKSDTADSLAISKFLSINEKLKSHEIKPSSLSDEYLLGMFDKHTHHFFETYVNPIVNLGLLAEVGRSGPGSSVAADGTDFYTKFFSSRISTTSDTLYDVYVRRYLRDPRWVIAEETRRTTYGGPVLVQHSNLSCVAKTREISRTICTEPLLNMFYQLGLGAVLTWALKRSYSIDLSTQQEKNRMLAWEGSLTDRFCTIDLASASDSVSLQLCKRSVPGYVHSLLHLLRTPSTRLPDSRVVDLQMVSTMGNGFTFPLQTILFSCAVHSAYDLSNIKLVRGRAADTGNFGVFGDDIICDKRAYAKLIRLLELLGFSVNMDKSFYEGYFRESCGEDYFLGQNIRGVYIESLRTDQDLCTVVNRLTRWCAASDINLPETLAYLLGHSRRLYVPRWENDDSGIHAPLSALYTRPAKDRATQSAFYRRYVVRPREMRLQNGSLWVPKGLKPRLLNEEGWGLSTLYGTVKAGRVTLRNKQGDRPHYQIKKAIAPNWDTPSAADSLIGNSRWLRWENVTRRAIESRKRDEDHF